MSRHHRSPGSSRPQFIIGQEVPMIGYVGPRADLCSLRDVLKRDGRSGSRRRLLVVMTDDKIAFRGSQVEQGLAREDQAGAAPANRAADRENAENPLRQGRETVVFVRSAVPRLRGDHGGVPPSRGRAWMNVPHAAAGSGWGATANGRNGGGEQKRTASASREFLFDAHGASRTHTLGILSPLPLPLGYVGF